MSAQMDKLRFYIKHDLKSPIEISDDIDLIDNRLIDSLRFVEFVLLISEISGKNISLEEVNVDDFRTLERIREVYFTNTPESQSA